MDEFIKDYRTIATGSFGATITALVAYFHLPDYVLQAIIGITVILELVFLRIGMKSETNKQTQALEDHTMTVARIIANNGTLPVDDTTKVVEQKPAPVTPQTVSVTMSDGSTKTIPVTELSQDFLSKITSEN